MPVFSARFAAPAHPSFVTVAKRKSLRLLAACAIHLLTLPAAQAQEAAAAPTIYVSEFQAIHQDAKPPTGILTRLKSEIRQDKAEGSASRLAQDIVDQLNDQGTKAVYLHADDPMPKSGYLVSGAFYATDPKGGLLSLSFLNSTPNTEIKLDVADLSAQPGQETDKIDTHYKLQGQGSNFSLNPYEMAAKVVVHKVVADQSITALAKDLATQILATQTAAPSAPQSAAAE